MYAFILEISTFKQAMRLKFGINNFGKRTIYNLQTKARLEKNPLGKLIKSLTNFIYQWVPPI